MSFLSNTQYLIQTSVFNRSKVGEPIPVITGTHKDPPNTLANGIFVKTDAVYSRQEYPELANNIGTIFLTQRPLIANLRGGFSGVTSNLNSVLYVSQTATYIAVGDQGTILTSANANIWVTRTSGTTDITLYA